MISAIVSSLGSNEKKAFFTNLYRSYYSIMKRTVIRVTGKSVNADDVIQDALLRLLSKYEKLSVMTKAATACYIYLTVKSTAIDALRRKHREQSWSYYGAEQDFAGFACHFDTPEQALIKDERRAELRKIMKRLSAPQRDLLLYKYVLEMPNSELACIYGTTEVNIRQMLCRARRKLCALLEDYNEGTN